MEQKKQREKKKLRQLNIACIGAAGHGKSSVVNWLTGKQVLINEQLKIENERKEVEKIEKEIKEKEDRERKLREQEAALQRELEIQETENQPNTASEGQVQQPEQVVEQVQQQQVQQVQEVPQAQKNAYITDMVRKHHYLYHKNYHMNIFDLPSGKDQTIIQNVMSIPNVLFVISARNDDYNTGIGEIKHLLQQCELLNVKRIVFAINFMDHWPSCNWNKTRYNNLVNLVTELCSEVFHYKKEPIQFTFSPVSALEGENILKQSKVDILIDHGICRWFQQENIKNLLSSIEELMIDKGKTKTQRELKYYMKKKPLRITVIGTIHDVVEVENDLYSQFQNDVDENEENVKGAFVYVHSGKIRRDTKLLLQPGQLFTVVKKIEYFTKMQFEQQQKVKQFFEDQNIEKQYDVPSHASAGSLCYIYFHNMEKMSIPVGTVGGVPESKKIPQIADTFVAKLKVVSSKINLGLHQICFCLCGLQEFSIKIFEVQAVFDQKFGRINQGQRAQQNNIKLEKNYIYQVQMSVVGSVCMERFNFISSFGQCFIFVKGVIAAVARIEEIGLKFNSIDYLPRVFAVPKEQLKDVITGEQREDWNICQIDLTKSVNTLLLPCGHIKMCSGCAQKCYRCPFCNCQVHERKKMQTIQMEENIALMEFALCDSCVTNRITHAVMDCFHYKCLCQKCVDKFSLQQECQLCSKVHLMVKIYI